MESTSNQEDELFEDESTVVGSEYDEEMDGSVYSMETAVARKTNVVTAARLRPMTTAEKRRGCRCIIDMDVKDSQSVRITNPAALPARVPVSIKASGTKCTPPPVRIPPRYVHQFEFDHLLPPSASQEDVYDAIGLDVTKAAIEGYNCACLVFGQTGAGKTYTMLGSERVKEAEGPSTDEQAAIPKHRGLILRIGAALFEQLETYTLDVTYVEIFQEHVYDLLSKSESRQALRVREHPTTGVFIEHVTRQRVTSFQELKDLVLAGHQNRSTAATRKNPRSSRSHAILTLHLSQRVGEDTMKRSKVCLVDLAGSEKADVRGNTGRESRVVNKSLTTLTDVIAALAHHPSQGKSAQSTFIPYRNAVLTRLLKDYLGGNAKTFMLANVSPACTSYNESAATLRSIERGRTIESYAKVNIEQRRASHANQVRRLVSQLQIETRTKDTKRETDITTFSCPHDDCLSVDSTSSGDQVSHLSENRHIGTEEEEEGMLESVSNQVESRSSSILGHLADQAERPESSPRRVKGPSLRLHTPSISKTDGQVALEKATARIRELETQLQAKEEKASIVDEIGESPARELEKQLQLVEDELEATILNVQNWSDSQLSRATCTECMNLEKLKQELETQLEVANKQNTVQANEIQRLQEELAIYQEQEQKIKASSTSKPRRWQQLTHKFLGANVALALVGLLLLARKQSH